MCIISSNRRYGWLPEFSNYHGVSFAEVGVHFVKLSLSAKPALLAFLQRQRSMIGRLVFFIAFASFSFEASAMYKCVDANGSSSFQDSPCQASVHDTSKDPVAGTKGPIPSQEVERKVLPPSQPLQIEETSNQGQNINNTQSDAGGSVSTSNTGSTGQGQSHPASQIFIAFVPLFIYFGFAALQGWWASARNRSFWSWFFLSLIFTPGLIFLIFLFRGEDPDRPSWAR